MAKRNVKLLRELVFTQDNKCCYCGNSFGTLMEQPMMTFLKATLEHFIPVVMGGDTDEKNCFAACQLCNRLKNTKLFLTMTEAKKYMTKRWKKKRYLLAETL
jgi:5-methylcytosine-specific restriction endonuclease McrA